MCEKLTESMMWRGLRNCAKCVQIGKFMKLWKFWKIEKKGSNPDGLIKNRKIKSRKFLKICVKNKYQIKKNVRRNVGNTERLLEKVWNCAKKNGKGLKNVRRGKNVGNWYEHIENVWEIVQNVKKFENLLDFKNFEKYVN